MLVVETVLPALEAAELAEDPSFPLQAAMVAAIIRAARAKAIFFILFFPLFFLNFKARASQALPGSRPVTQTI